MVQGLPLLSPFIISLPTNPVFDRTKERASVVKKVNMAGVQ
jgi:hypothetical protein